MLKENIFLLHVLIFEIFPERKNNFSLPVCFNYVQRNYILIFAMGLAEDVYFIKA